MLMFYCYRQTITLQVFLMTSSCTYEEVCLAVKLSWNINGNIFTEDTSSCHFLIIENIDL